MLLFAGRHSRSSSSCTKILRTILCSATTSALLYSSPNFALNRGNSLHIKTTSSSASSPLSMSSSTNQDSSFTLPTPTSVLPGTSPVESQPIRNPIDSSCTVLVVGGTRGIGLEFVKQCAVKGATVIASHRSSNLPESLQTLQNDETIQKSNTGSVQGLQIDLSDEESISQAASKLKEILGEKPLTHIIHSAGIYLPGTSFDGTARGPRAPAPPVTKSIMMETFALNTIAPLLVAQNFTPLMKPKTNASELEQPILAFLTSKVGSIDDNNSGGAYAYRSSKSALNNIAKSLSIDLAGEISVVLLHPGFVRTDMTGGKGLIDVDESVGGMLKAVECTDASVGFRFVDYKACLIPW